MKHPNGDHLSLPSTGPENTPCSPFLVTTTGRSLWRRSQSECNDKQCNDKHRRILVANPTPTRLHVLIDHVWRIDDRENFILRDEPQNYAHSRFAFGVCELLSRRCWSRYPLDKSDVFGLYWGHAAAPNFLFPPLTSEVQKPTIITASVFLAHKRDCRWSISACEDRRTKGEDDP